MKKPKLRRIHLCVLPTKIYFCPDQEEFDKHAAKLGYPGWPYPVSDGAVTYFKRPGEHGYASVVLTVADRLFSEGLTRAAAVIVHECVHLVARIREDIGDTDKMGEEYEAYLHQYLFEMMWLEFSRMLAYRQSLGEKN